MSFMRMPDISDTWGVCFPENEPREAPGENAEQYHVSVEQVSGLEQYDKWMNEED